MIGIDWGTSSQRAFRMDADGVVVERREAGRGILHVEGKRFGEALRGIAGDWIDAGERRVLLSGMIGSRQGWVEAPYLPCPAGPDDLAGALVPVPFEGAQVLLVPGLTDADDADTPEVMRGEETQLAGLPSLLEEDALACLPGSHSKWARLAEGRITAFRTYLSGEMFAALRAATILGRMMTEGPTLPAAFDRGVARSGESGHLLHHIFGVRSLGLMGRLANDDAASYLSGLLIGHEVRAALPTARRVHLVGSPALCSLYARAVGACGGSAVIEDSEAASRGLARIGRAAKWD
jgi:2-dehydro-3-deoxygalactonokinase